MAVSDFGFWTYIVASQRNGTIYTGHTDDLSKRIWEHRTGAYRGFSARYGCKLLVWYEQFDTRVLALERERQIKEWRRAWKIALIEKTNPQWLDLSEEVRRW